MMTPQNHEQAAERLAAMRSEIAKAVVGQHAIIDQALIALLAGGHVLIEGVPGLGKTLLVRAMARTFDGQFGRIQFTPDLMPADVTGHALYDMKAGQFVIRRGPVFTNLLLADEINRAPAKTQAALLEAMQEGQTTIEGRAQPLPAPFMTFATQNPIEQEGTYPLPEAQLDRFLMKIRIDYPSLAEEIALVEQVTTGKVGDALEVAHLTPQLDVAGIQALREITARITVDQAVMDYAVRLTRATRDWAGILAGAGPRGAIALVRAARGQALLEGRDFVTPDDIKGVALPVLRHRVTPTPDSLLDGADPDRLIGRLLDHVPAPAR